MDYVDDRLLVAGFDPWCVGGDADLRGRTVLSLEHGRSITRRLQGRVFYIYMNGLPFVLRRRSFQTDIHGRPP
jgi:hypothetical protein